MINNINNYTSFSNTGTSSSSTPELDDLLAKHQRAKAPKVDEEISQGSSLYLSTRAQKINTLSTEFFSGGGLTFSDVSALKNRIYQLGLISKADFAKLTNTELTEEELAASNNKSSQGIANYIDDFLLRLNESNVKQENTQNEDSNTEESESLIALRSALVSAQNMIANVENAKSEENFKDSLFNAMAIIKNTINTRAFDMMPPDDKVGIAKVYQTLELVDKISIPRLTNDKLNKYIEVSFE